jgi:hypothetical protein
MTQKSIHLVFVPPSGSVSIIGCGFVHEFGSAMSVVVEKCGANLSDFFSSANW